MTGGIANFWGGLSLKGSCYNAAHHVHMGSISRANASVALAQRNAFFMGSMFIAGGFAALRL